MKTDQQPFIVLKEGTTREKGKDARSSNIAAAVAISDAVKSTLGPKGMDKMSIDSMGDVVITNDGATLLKEIDIDHPAAKMIVEVAKSQDEECGDGTTTAVVLAGELLKSASGMIDQHIHPTVISKGYKIAADKAVEFLNDLAIPIKPGDKKTLKNIAMTAMASKGASGSKEILAVIVVDAVSNIVESINGQNFVDLDNIQVQKQKSGSIDETEIVKGIILDKERLHKDMPRYVNNARIALVNAAFEVKKTEVDARIQINDPNQLQTFLDEEENMLKKMVDKVKDSGAIVLVCQKGIEDIAQHYLAKEGIYAVRRAKKSDMEKLSKATGAKIVANIDDLISNDLGIAGKIEEKKYDDAKLTFISECKNPKAVSILVRGGTEHVVDELERGLNDSLSVVKVALEDSKMTAGGGATAAAIAMALREYAPSVGGREQMAVEAFADGLEVIPKILSQNAGLDPIDMILKVRQAHKKGNKFAGINVFTGKVEDMMKNNVVEPLRLGIQEVQAAYEAANMVLRIDDVIAANSTEKNKTLPSGGPGMGGVQPGGMEY